MSAVLRVVDLRREFVGPRQRIEVLRGVSFELPEGAALAVTGPSGSGKSTLLHLLGALDRPTAGTVELDGRRPHDLGEAELARFRNESVGFVFQDPHLLPQYTVLENVLLPALAFGRAGDDATRRARQLLQRVGLSSRIEHRPAELSGGERQRAAVARALIRSPRLLLCDEPTGSLDAATARSVADLIFEMHREESGVLIVVTHSVELAGRFDRRFELSQGECFAA